MPFSGLVFIGIISYGVLEWSLHFVTLKERKFSFSWKRLLAILSIGYAFADYCKEEKNLNLKSFIERCNHWNFIVSLILMVCSFLILRYSESQNLMLLIQTINGYRFISRSFEIIFAFSFDVLRKSENENGKSGLNKFERLQLAVISYFEIYIYSISFYLSIITQNNFDFNTLILKSIQMSLSVGTLTNVAFSQDEKLLSNWLQLLPFVQVIATLSLVVLSLAIYVSRNDDNKKETETALEATKINS